MTNTETTKTGYIREGGYGSWPCGTELPSKAAGRISFPATTVWKNMLKMFLTYIQIFQKGK